MCGIVGVLNFDSEQISKQTIESMLRVIRHRGPDNEGFYIDHQLGFGHCRLAIIDKSSRGHQPMLSTRYSYVLNYNGEIYNYKELRELLVSEGYEFHSNTDTEVLLNSYIKWGTDVLYHLNGMFAFAIWDNIKKELFLARDRYGIKPLYYYLNRKSFIFGSEVKSISAHPDYIIRLNKDALLEYFTFQNNISGNTFFDEIQLLPPGSYIKLSLNNSHCEIHKYWNFRYDESPVRLSEREYIAETSNLIQQAVTRQLNSDVPLGCYLSGGVDSGLIVAIASSKYPKLKTFTCGFEMSTGLTEKYIDERRVAKRISTLCSTDYFELQIDAQSLQSSLPALIYHLETPLVGPTYPNYLISQLSSLHVKTVLSGIGGDELFAGYPWRYYPFMINNNINDFLEKYYLHWHRVIPPSILTKMFQPISSKIDLDKTRDIFTSFFSDQYSPSKPIEYINLMLSFEANTFLHGLLTAEDKISMAYGLETRVPFLDNNLVDFAITIPVEFKLGMFNKVLNLYQKKQQRKIEEYLSKPQDGKWILREIMKTYYPLEITKLKKQGFVAPEVTWHRTINRRYISERLQSQDAQIFEYLDRSIIHELVDEHLQGKFNWHRLIWSLLCFSQWCEEFIK